MSTTSNSDQTDQTDQTKKSKPRALFNEACRRLGVDSAEAEAVLGPPDRLIKFDEAMDVWRWEDHSSIAQGLRSSLPAELMEHAGGDHPNSESAQRSRLERQLNQAEAEHTEARRNYFQSGGDNGYLRLAGDKRKAVQEIQQQLAELDQKDEPPAPPAPTMTAQDHAKLRSLEQATEKARIALRRSPRDNSRLAAFSRANRELQEFKRRFG